MKISKFTAENEVVAIEVEGEVDAHTARELDKAISDLLAQGHSRLALDISQIDFISSAGLRVVIYAHQEALQHGGRVKLFGLNTRVRRVFEMAGLDESLSLSDTLQEALEGW